MNDRSKQIMAGLKHLLSDPPPEEALLRPIVVEADGSGELHITSPSLPEVEVTAKSSSEILPEANAAIEAALSHEADAPDPGEARAAED